MSFTIGTATFTNGSKNVTNVSLTSGKTSYFARGTRVVVGANPVIAEVEATNAPTNSTFTLAQAWPHATGSYAFLANMTSEGVRDAVQNIRDYIGRVQGESAALARLYDSTADGLADTLSGDYFNVIVPSDPDIYSQMYLNDGGVAVLQVEMPTKAALEAATLAASLSANNAAGSAGAALTSENNAATSESNAAASEALAQKWASEAEDVPVVGTDYSALHWAAKAADSAASINPTVPPTPDTVVQRTATGAVRAADGVNADEAVVLGQLGTAATMEIATTAQAQALTGDGVVITPKKLGDAMNTHVLGMGQTWQDMTGSRHFGTTYTNTTGRPIFVSVSCAVSEETPPQPLTLTVQGVIISTYFVNSEFGGVMSMLTVQGIVPDGSAYRVDAPSPYLAIEWSELR